MAQGKWTLTIIAITLCCGILSAHARPQNFDNELFPVDGFAFDGPAQGLDPITLDRTTRASDPYGPISTTTTTTTAATTMTVERCMNLCQNTSEYNPICGTDGVVYSNPGRLGCAQRCGKAVTLSNYGACVSNPRG